MRHNILKLEKYWNIFNFPFSGPEGEGQEEDKPTENKQCFNERNSGKMLVQLLFSVYVKRY